MNLIKSKQIYVFLSLISAVGMFFMTTAFQGMAYWGDNLTWFWVGVALTYLIWLLGILFLIVAITKRKNIEQKFIVGLSIMEIISLLLLICGFCWTTFIILFGVSGL